MILLTWRLIDVGEVSPLSQKILPIVHGDQLLPTDVLSLRHSLRSDQRHRYDLIAIVSGIGLYML